MWDRPQHPPATRHVSQTARQESRCTPKTHQVVGALALRTRVPAGVPDISLDEEPEVSACRQRALSYALNDEISRHRRPVRGGQDLICRWGGRRLRGGRGGWCCRRNFGGAVGWTTGGFAGAVGVAGGTAVAVAVGGVGAVGVGGAAVGGSTATSQPPSVAVERRVSGPVAGGRCRWRVAAWVSASGAGWRRVFGVGGAVAAWVTASAAGCSSRPAARRPRMYPTAPASSTATAINAMEAPPALDAAPERRRRATERDADGLPEVRASRRCHGRGCEVGARGQTWRWVATKAASSAAFSSPA